MLDTLHPEDVGPVDVAVIRFAGNEFSGDVAPALAELSDSGTVRIIDLAFVRKDADGSTTVIEATDAEIADTVQRVIGRQFDLLSEEDLDDVADTLEAGSSALVLVWENSWAARFAAAVRQSRGEVLAMQRIPRETVLTAIAALEED